MGPARRLRLWDIDLANLATERAGDGFSRLGPGEAAGLAVATSMPLSEVTARLAWSNCVVGRIRDRIVTFGWVSRVDTPIGEIDATIRPGPDTAYIWDCATAPEYRGQGLFRRLLRHIVVALAEEELRHAWIGTLQENLAGCRAVELAGFHPVLRVTYAPGAPPRWSVEPAAGASPAEVDILRAALTVRQTEARAGAGYP